MRLDRSTIGALNQEYLKAIREMGAYRLKHPDKPNVVFPDDFMSKASYVYEAQYNLHGAEKIYYLTEKTMRRVRGMNVTSFLGPDSEACKMVFTEDECKYIVFDTTSPYGIGSMAYCIKEGHLYAKVYSGEYIAGYIISDEKDGYKLCMVPYSIFSMLHAMSFPDMRNGGADIIDKQLKIVKKDFGEGSVAKMSNIELVRISKRKDFDKMYSHDMIEDHITFLGVLFEALGALIFLKTAEVYSQEYVPDSTPTFRRKKGYKPLNYILVDSTWDKNIDVNNPFPVRGHFKMQPYKKDGKWDKKLIYIESYMKTGYHRRAKKIIDNETRAFE